MSTNTDAQIRNIYERWHETIVARDLPGLKALYAEDAIFERPAVLALNGTGSGVLKGRAEIEAYFAVFFRKLDRSVVDWYRSGTFFSDGRLLTWEYPRESPRGDQNDVVEWMEVRDGLIAHHRVYWGWVGMRTLLGASEAG